MTEPVFYVDVDGTIREEKRIDWLAAPPADRASQVNWSSETAHNGWAEHQRACTAEGRCPVCLGPLGGPGPSPGYAVAAGNCEAADCPAAPCRWAITMPYPSGHPGALMYAPLVR
jgi:hypothetical protein